MHSLNDKTKRSKQAHKTALDTSKPDVEGTKKDVSEAISTTPVVNQQAGEPAVNPEKKKKNKNKKVVLGQVLQSQFDSNQYSEVAKVQED